MFIYQNVKYFLCILQKIFSSQKTVQIFVGFLKNNLLIAVPAKKENITQLIYSISLCLAHYNT